MRKVNKEPVESSVRNDAGLTSRELEVLDLIDKDMINHEIAEKLVIEASTVKDHVHSILENLMLVIGETPQPI